MTTILGLHFGHDASVAVVVDGCVTGFVQRERISRIKHAYSLDRECLELAITQSKIDLRQVDIVTVTSTQGSEPILYHLDGFNMAYDVRAAIGPEPLLVPFLGYTKEVENYCAPSMVQRVLGKPRDPRTHPAFDHYFSEYRGVPFAEMRRFPWLDLHVELPEWRTVQRLDGIANIPIHCRENDDRCRYGFHYPLRVSIDGRNFPGIRVDHHLAHAASSFYRCGATSALVVTNDGYGGRRAAFANGGVYLGLKNAIVALAPHFLTHGYLYDAVARRLGLGSVGASGKLMGLAPYGESVLYDPRFIGTAADHSSLGIDGSPSGWISFAAARAKRAVRPPGKHSIDLPFSPFALNLAASTQLLFEETWLALIRAATFSLSREGRSVEALCLSGGAALNCPANSRIVREAGYSQLFIEPNCDDGGLSIGSALWAYHGLLGNTVSRSAPLSIQEIYGRPYLPAITRQEIQVTDGISLSRPGNPADEAARDLVDGWIVGWFEGGSEMGPRALGHRSILADPRLPDIKRRINSLKGREPWRPLAPMVIHREASNFFDLRGLPEASPFMLFTAKITNQNLAAVTHVDKSSRLQTVTPECGVIYEVLLAFERLTGIGVILNTSLNRRGEPIAESPRDALKMLKCKIVDALYLDGIRLTLEGNELR